MKVSSRSLLLAGSSLAVILAILGCIHYVDGKVASGIWKFTSSHPALHNRIKEISSPFHELIAVATIVMWITYLFVSRTQGHSKLVQFIKLAATAVPAAFLTKSFLQYAFGRTSLRLWLLIGGPIEFRWFHPIESGGFPSGHMIVVAAFMTAVWLYYQRLRPLAISLTAALAAALLITSYHFVSDILAGGLCGVVITALINCLYTTTRNASP